MDFSCEEHNYFIFFFRNTGTERTHVLAQEYQPLGVGIVERDVHQKNGDDFLLYFPAEQEPVISPCLSTVGHELTKMCMCRVCSVSIHLRKGLDLCALKIWWIKETWKCVLLVKSCLPEMQTDNCSGPRGLSFSFFQKMHKATELEPDIRACLQKIYLQSVCVLTVI